MEDRLNIVLISDNQEDQHRIVSELCHLFPNVEVEQVDDYVDFYEVVQQDHFNLVVTDYQTDWINGIEATQIIKRFHPNCPVLMFTDKGNEEVAATAIKAGLDDYVVKTPANNSCLRLAVRSAHEQAHQREVIKETEIRYQNLFDGIQVGLFKTTQQGIFTDVNKAFVDMFGYEDIANFHGTKIQDIFVDPDECEQWQALLNRHNVVRDFTTRMYRSDGAMIWVEISSHITRSSSNSLFCYEGSIKNISKRREAEEKLNLTAQRLGILHQIDQVIHVSTDINHTIMSTLEKINSLFDCDWSNIELYDEKQNIAWRYTIVYGDHAIFQEEVPLEEAVFRKGLAEGEAQLIKNNPNLLRMPIADHQTIFHETSTYVSVPLISDTIRIGTLNIGTNSPDIFVEENLQMAKEVTVPLSIAIQKLRLEEAELRASRIAQVFHQATIALTRSLDPRQVLETLLKFLSDFIHYDKATIVMMRQNFHVVSQAEYANECVHVTLDSEICQCNIFEHPVFSIPLTTEQTLVINDVAAFPNWCTHKIGEDIRSWIGVPLMAEKKALGLFSIGKTSLKGFSSEEVEWVEALAAQASTSLHNALLYQQVCEGEEKLRQLAHKVVLSQEEERKLISQDLHDEAGQALTVLKIGLKLLQSDVPPEFSHLTINLDELIELTDTTLIQVKNLAQNLRPPILDTVGLDLTLEDYCEKFSKRTKIETHYQGAELPIMADAINICLYRCLQEGLTNVAKHSSADSVDVTLSCFNRCIRLSIRDNGVGFPVGHPSSVDTQRMGLVGMRERVSLMNGTMEIQTQPDQGVSLVIEIPMEAAL